MSSLTAFESCLSMQQLTGAGRPAASCAWTRTACLSGRLSVSRGPSTLPYLLLLSMPRHTSSLSSSHALSSTLRRKTLSRLMEGPSLAGLHPRQAARALCSGAQERNGAFKPHSHLSAPAAPFNNILSPMRQDYACLQSATVIHFAARGIKRYSKRE